MGVKKLSEIAPAGVMPALTDQVVGVTTGTIDNLFTLQQIKTVVGGGGSGTPGGANTDVQFNNSGSLGGDSGFTYAGAGGAITVTPAANTNPFSITGGSITGAGVNVLGPKVAGTLNTSGIVDGATFFANITNTASGAGTTALDLQVGGTSIFNIDMLGNIFLSGSRTISSSTGLTIEQTGDTFGPTAFFLANRTGVNGATFEQLGTVSVVDFVFLINGSGPSNGQSNMRYERRTAFFVFGASNNAANTVNEFQIGQPYFGILSPTTTPYMIAGEAECGVASATGTFSISSFTNKQAILNFRVPTNTVICYLQGRTDTGGFITTQNTVFELQVVQPFTVKFAIGDTVTFFNTKPQFALNTTGGGSALLGANCPAVTVTAPYTWIEMVSSDGSAVFVPAWK